MNLLLYIAKCLMVLTVAAYICLIRPHCIQVVSCPRQVTLYINDTVGSFVD